MDYLSYFGLSAEPFSNAPLARYYYGSKQHTESLERLTYAAKSMKGLAILVGDIGLGKTTLARRLLESLPDSEYEAAMLIIVHAGITSSWLLKRIAMQLGVPQPADDKIAILSQLYQRLVEIHHAGKRAVVLIDEAQMLATREIMEEFRGLLNLEVPEHKLITFVFFGLPELESNLRLDPPLAQRIALRYHLKPLGPDDAAAYIEHRLSLAGGAGLELFSLEAIQEIFRHTRGVPRLINTLCDNLLLEMFFARTRQGDWQMVATVAQNLGFADLHKQATVPDGPAPGGDMVAAVGGPGHDAVVGLGRRAVDLPEKLPADVAAPVTSAPVSQRQAAVSAMAFEPADIAEQVASEPFEPAGSRRQVNAELDRGPEAKPVTLAAETTVDIEDPLAFLGDEIGPSEPAKSPGPAAWTAEDPEVEIDDGLEVDVSFEVAPAVSAAAQPVAKPGTKRPAVDLKEIDDLLADLNARKTPRRL